MEVTLRPATDADAPFLRDVYASTRTEELAQVDWTDEQKAAFLSSQFAAQDAHYRGYPGATFEVVLVDGQPVGRCYVARWAEELRVVDISVLPEHRGQGIGRELLGDLLAEAARTGVKVSVHVEKLNRARTLYERLGFVEVEDTGVYLRMERPAPHAVS